MWYNYTMMLLLSKFILFFIAAIWGIVLGILVPASMLIWEDIASEVPAVIPALWLCASVAGLIAPCVLVRLKMYRIAAVSSVAGAFAMIAVHFAMSNYIVNALFMWFYLPLLAGTAATLIILVLDLLEKRNDKHNAPAPSILGKLEEDDKYKMKSFEEKPKGDNQNGTVRPETPVSHKRKRRR